MITVFKKHFELPEQQTNNNKITVNKLFIENSFDYSSKRNVVQKKLYSMPFKYNLNYNNGQPIETVQKLFPNDKYDLPTPTYAHHYFLGWFTENGTQVNSNDKVRFSKTNLIAHWQDPTIITFDSTTNGGNNLTWEYDYFDNLPYNSLPRPTHPTLSFIGWATSPTEYNSSTKINQNSIVNGPKTLYAHYAAQSYSVRLNNSWQQSTISPPTDQIYDVYESYSNKNIDNSYANMFIDLIGYTNFTIYIANNSEYNYDYTIACYVGEQPEYMMEYYNYNYQGASYGNNITSFSSIDSWTRVDYALNGGSNTICIQYRKDSSVSNGNDCGYLLIPTIQ